MLSDLVRVICIFLNRYEMVPSWLASIWFNSPDKQQFGYLGWRPAVWPFHA